MVAQYEGNGTQNENEFAVYNAVQCADVDWPRSFAYWTSDTELVYKTAPFQAWDNAWFNAACAFWPVKGRLSRCRSRRGAAAHLDAAGHAGPGHPYAAPRTRTSCCRPRGWWWSWGRQPRAVARAAV